MECRVCVGKILPSSNATCPYCSFEVCKTCVMTYFGTQSDDFNCMNCHVKYDRRTLLSLLPKTSVNGALKRRREEVLFERELSMMPATQPYVEHELKVRKNAEKIAELSRLRESLREKVTETSNFIYRLQRESATRVGLETRRAFVHKCPLASCRGFLSAAYKCSVCLNYTCPECNAIKGPDRAAPHVCDPVDVQNVSLIKKDSKPCPGCGEFISKISGCDQMWCVSCHVAFSWNTGRIVNGQIHNPHWYEWHRRQGGGQRLGREHGDIPCGGRPSIFELRTLRKLLSPADYDRITGVHMLTTHIENVELPRYRVQQGFADNVDLRVKYMLGDLTKDEVKVLVQKKEKLISKKRDIEQILAMFVNAADDMLRKTILEKSATVLREMESLVVYVNETVSAVSAQYNCVVPSIVVETLRVRTIKASK